MSPSAAVVERYDATTRAEALAQIDRAGTYVLDVESIVRHVHASLEVTVDGVAVPVAQAGVDFDTLTAAPVHTHGTDGVLHVEADAAHASVPVLLSDFFAVLGAGRSADDLCQFYLGPSAVCTVTVTVNGAAADLDHILEDRDTVSVAVTTSAEDVPGLLPSWSV
jgi:hypothetical protein